MSRAVSARFDADKVRAHIANSEQEIAEQEHLVNWLNQAYDDALRDLYTKQSQLNEFIDMTHESAAEDQS